MARALGESPSKVAAWKRSGHIPARKQAAVLQKGMALGIELVAENVVFPLGRPSDVANTITATPAPVACPVQAEVQCTGAAR